jgi:hypothetical protein
MKVTALRMDGYLQDSRQSKGINSSPHGLIPGRCQPPTQCLPGTVCLGIKRPELQDDYSTMSSTEVNNACRYTNTSTPPYTLMAQCAIEHRIVYLIQCKQKDSYPSARCKGMCKPGTRCWRLVSFRSRLAYPQGKTLGSY